MILFDVIIKRRPKEESLIKESEATVGRIGRRILALDKEEDVSFMLIGDVGPL